LNAHALEVLEFEKVRRMLIRWTFSIPGRERAESLRPDLDHAHVLRSQVRIAEWRRLELRGNAPGAAEMGDLRPLLLRLRRSEASLEGRELTLFLPFLDHLRRLRGLWEEAVGAADEMPALSQLLRDIGDFSPARARLARSLAPSGELLDTASPELARIRRELFDSRQRAADLLEGMRQRLRDDREDTFVTLREGRYVLSVRSHHRAQLPGLIHGHSQSGQSVLLEPMEAVEANNRVAEAREDEHYEEVRILGELTGTLREHAPDLDRAFGVVGELDLVRAATCLALDQRAEAPALNEQGRLRVVRGRHPLLAEAEARGGAKVVPLDLDMNVSDPVLLVSGPNMGGKTVALKTVGLLVLMARAGLFVPAADGTDLPLVDEVFVDLGDEQSIEGDLSTFAGHLRNIGEMWEKAGESSLVILDELGGGTDPEEGAALGMALLEGLAERGTLTVATTHLTAVKLFAADRAGMRNAAMEFDPLSMTPRFRLVIGEPGTSRAFDIARRILPRLDLLDRAERYRSPLLIQMEELFGRIDAERARVEAERRKLEEERERVREATERRDRQATRLRERLDKLKTERRAAAGKIYEDAQSFVRNLKESLESAAAKQVSIVIPELKRVERELDQKIAQVQRTPVTELPGRRLAAEKTRPGEDAWIPRLRAIVRIERMSGDRVWVDWQGRRFEVSRTELEEPPVAPDRRPEERRGPQSHRRTEAGRTSTLIDEAPAESVVRELDLRGCRVEEALQMLDAYLDKASLGRLHQVRIVHGKGTGVLKREIEKHLRGHPLVSSFRTGELAEGSWGVTVASLGPEQP
jgi:DNA mismatch repair protein MutS2